MVEKKVDLIFESDTEENNHKDPHKENREIFNTTGFKDFMLKNELLRAIQEAGFEHPSDVQQEAMPVALNGRDCLVQAKSGMGKTAVFVLSILQQMDYSTTDKNRLQCIVLCHARELAIQIRNEFQRLGKYLNVQVVACYGGGGNQGVNDNIDQLRKNNPHVIVGCPGRIKHLVEKKSINTEKIRFFVMDECDQMLKNDSMRQDVQEIFVKTKKEKQSMMFTATLNTKMKEICKKYLQNPHEVTVEDEFKLSLHSMDQYYVELDEKQKNAKLINLLDHIDFNQVIIFVRKNDRAQVLAGVLKDLKFPAGYTHAGLDQPEREKVFEQFKKYELRVLVSTDLFSRGVDVDKINMVVNYDMPENTDTYLHRVGRAGRFGTRGLAVSFISSPEDKKILTEVRTRFAREIPFLPENLDSRFLIKTA